MEFKIKLSTVVDYFEMISDNTTIYLNTINYEFIILSEYDEDYDERFEYITTSEEYISLPNRYDLNEYAMMKKYILTLDNPVYRFQLSNAIIGTGAFSRFKNLIRYYQIEKSWYSFKTNELIIKAKAFLDEHDIPYETDMYVDLELAKTKRSILPLDIKTKLIYMNNSELVDLIDELCLRNKDVLQYLSNRETDKTEIYKINDMIDCIFQDDDIDLKEALHIFLQLRRTTNDDKAVLEVGANLFEKLNTIAKIKPKDISLLCDALEVFCYSIILTEELSYVESLKETLKVYEITDSRSYDKLISVYFNFFD